MIILGFAVVGALMGLRGAVRAQGNRLDRLQYAAVGAIAGAILGTAVTIGLERML